MDFSKIEFLDVDGKKVDLDPNETPFFRPSIYVAVRNSEGKYMFIIDESSMNWEFPGGGLDLNETFEEGAIREIKEETGYDIRLVDSQPFFVDQQFGYFRRANKFAVMLIYYFIGELVHEKQGEQNFMDGENILEVKWMDKEEIMKLGTIFTQQPALDYFKKNILKD